MKIKCFNNLEKVVKQILKDLKLTEIQNSILFAPACSSYDQYLNFEQRGEEFTKLINQKLLNL